MEDILKEWHKKHHVTQQDLADLCKVSRSLVARWESKRLEYLALPDTYSLTVLFREYPDCPLVPRSQHASLKILIAQMEQEEAYMDKIKYLFKHRTGNDWDRFDSFDYNRNGKMIPWPEDYKGKTTYPEGFPSMTLDQLKEVLANEVS